MVETVRLLNICRWTAPQPHAATRPREFLDVNESKGIAYRLERPLRLGPGRLCSTRHGHSHCLHRVCECVLQPIRLILPHLFQDRLAKLTEHAAHADVIVGAVAQHDVRVAPIAQSLQRQAVRVLESVDRPVDASEQ